MGNGAASDANQSGSNGNGGEVFLVVIQVSSTSPYSLPCPFSAPIRQGAVAAQMHALSFVMHG
jgi:hypothetical protein